MVRSGSQFSPGSSKLTYKVVLSVVRIVIYVFYVLIVIYYEYFNYHHDCYYYFCI